MRYLFIGLVLIFGCNSNVEDLKNFNEQTWMADSNGCEGQRLEMIDELVQVQEQLRGLSQTELTKLLGKPDRHELYKRSQKLFYYQISPGKACSADTEENVYLSIRFNAMGLSKEVIIMNYDG